MNKIRLVLVLDDDEYLRYDVEQDDEKELDIFDLLCDEENENAEH